MFRPKVFWCVLALGSHTWWSNLVHFAKKCTFKVVGMLLKGIF